MRSRKNSERIGLLTLLVLLVAGCGSKGCYEDMSVKLYVNFYTLSKGALVTTTVDSLTVQGVGSDSILYVNKSLSGLALDLNPNATETAFAFSRTVDGTLLQDTLRFTHTNAPWFQSLDCGCRVDSRLKSCTVDSVVFKSAVIRDSSVINLKSEHVRLIL